MLKKMLAILAMLVAGYLAKQNRPGPAPTQNAGLGGMLGSLLGGSGAAGSANPPASGGGLASMLDMNGDGNPLDDIMRMAGKVMGQGLTTLQ